MNIRPNIYRYVVMSVAAIGLTGCDSPPTESWSRPPSVVIEAPTEQFSYAEGEAITFRGSATDPEDGPLSGNSLLWFSDVDGELGTGEEITVSDLSPSGHTIYLLARDSDGVTGNATVGVVVRAEAEMVVGR